MAVRTAAKATQQKTPYVPEITDLADYDEHHRWMIYGDAGSGKTVFAGTSPRVLIAYPEVGTMSAARMGAQGKKTPARTWRDFERLTTWIERIAIPQNKFDWYWLDSITKAQELCWRNALDSAHAENQARDLDIPAIQDYGKVQNQFKRILNKWIDFDANVGFTAHAMRSEDEEGEPLILPMLSGKNGTDDSKAMSLWMCGQVHLLGYLKAVEQQADDDESEFSNTLILRRYGPYIAKDRYNIGAWVDNPTVPDLLDLIEPSAKSAPVKRTRRGA
jgi:AAA domain-containing protein